MPARKGITRRRVVAGAAATFAAMRYPAEARPLMLLGGSPRTVAPPSGDYSITVGNTAGSASPAQTAILRPQWFVPGDVPTGWIAEPQIGGVDLPYQADNLPMWGESPNPVSQMGAEYRMISGSIPAGGTAKIDWVIRSGSYNNTSAITLADVIAETDFNLAIRNAHTANVVFGSGENCSVAFTISGGGITAATTHYWLIAVPPIVLTNEPITGGGGTGATVSSDGVGNLTITNPGTGYGLLNGTGIFNPSFNAGVAAVIANGNNVNGYYLVQYAKGPFCDAWRLRMPIFQHFFVEWYIERWKKPDGSLLDYQFYAILRNAKVDTTTTMYTVTCDYDLRNGTTVIRGDTNGDIGYTNQPIYLGGAGATFDIDAQPDWLFNGAAFKAIKNRRTSAECLKLRETGVIPSQLAVTSSISVPTVHAYFEATLNGGVNKVCDYRPGGSAATRSPEGSGGGGNTESLIFELGPLHWNASRLGNYAAADVWEKNGRVGAAHALGSSQSGGMIVEPTTGFLPNCIPTSVQSFPGMLPTRQSLWVNDLPQGGNCHPIIQGQVNLTGGLGPYHQACFALYPYVMEGQRWMLDALIAAGLSVTFGASYGSRRQATIGSTTYYGLYAQRTSNVREEAWPTRTIGYAGQLAAPSFSDGTADQEARLCRFGVKSQFDYWNALVPHVGTVKFGTAGATLNKNYDFTGTGAFPEMIDDVVDHCEGIHVPFMFDYLAMTGYHLEWYYQGTAIGTAIAAWNDEFDNYYIGIITNPVSNFAFDSYRLLALTGIPPAPAADPTWHSIGDTANPRIGIYKSLNLSFVNGSSTVTLSAPWILYGTTELSSGARILLNGTYIENTTHGTDPPSPFSTTTWYYMKRLSSTTWQLCTDAALTSPVTALATLSSVSLQCWVCPLLSDLPADNSGHGTLNGGTSYGGATRIAIKLSTLRLRKATRVAGTTPQIDLAIANALAIHSSLPGATGTGYEDTQTVAWGDTR